MSKKKNNQKGSTNDGLALIIGGLFVLALVFATYSYFNRTPSLEEEVKSSATERLEGADTDKLSLGERIKELFNSGSDDGDINGEGMAASDEETTFDDSLGTGGPTVLYSVWEATDYHQGDIAGSSHVVQAGDTLWEIAEARYGSGADWTRILAANADSVGYLPSGEQALIMVGQTLVLPN